MNKQEIIERLKKIAAYGNTPDNREKYEVEINDWSKEDKDRTYFQIVKTTASGNKQIRRYGYWDNKKQEYVTGKYDKSLDYTFGGMRMKEE